MQNHTTAKTQTYEQQMSHMMQILQTNEKSNAETNHTNPTNKTNHTKILQTITNRDKTYKTKQHTHTNNNKT